MRDHVLQNTLTEEDVAAAKIADVKLREEVGPRFLVYEPPPYPHNIGADYAVHYDLENEPKISLENIINMTQRIEEWEISGLDWGITQTGDASDYPEGTGGTLHHSYHARTELGPQFQGHAYQSEIYDPIIKEGGEEGAETPAGKIALGERAFVRAVRSIKPRKEYKDYGFDFIIPGLQVDGGFGDQFKNVYPIGGRPSVYPHPPNNDKFLNDSLYTTSYFGEHIAMHSEDGFLSIGGGIGFSLYYEDMGPEVTGPYDHPQCLLYRKNERQEGVVKPPAFGGPRFRMDSGIGGYSSGGYGIGLLIYGGVKEPVTSKVLGTQMAPVTITVDPVIGPVFTMQAQGVMSYPMVSSQITDPTIILTWPAILYKASKFFPYANRKGQPVYDVNTGAQINDPFDH